MNYSTEELNGVTVVTVNLERATEEHAKGFKTYLFDLIEKSKVTKVVIDLSNVEYADSSFLGAIVSGLRKITAIKGDIKIIGLQSSVRAMFELTRLYRVFEIFDNKDDVLNSY